VMASPYNATGNGTTNDASAINSAIAASSEVYFPPGQYYVGSSTITVPVGEHLYGLGSGNTMIQGSGNPIINLQGARSGNANVLENIYIQRTGGTAGDIVHLNCDSSSLLFDDFVDSNSTTVAASVRVQSGGAFIENAWWTGSTLTSGSGNGGIVITSPDGPTTIYDLQPEHWIGPAVLCSGANNVTLMNLETEGGGTASGGIVTVANSNNINLHQCFFAASNLPIGIKLTSSTVNAWSLNMDTNSSGLVNDGGTAYGTTFLDAYIDFTGKPEVPGALSTITFQTPGAPGTLSTTKQ